MGHLQMGLSKIEQRNFARYQSTVTCPPLGLCSMPTKTDHFLEEAEPILDTCLLSIKDDLDQQPTIRISLKQERYKL
jgi:hypothetical protein